MKGRQLAVLIGLVLLVAFVGLFVGYALFAGNSSQSPTNVRPKAINDIVSATTLDTRIIVDVLKNDIINTGQNTTTNQELISIAKISQPSHGKSQLNANGTITYTPDSGFRGADQFSYTISNMQGTSDTAIVTINIVDDNVNNNGNQQNETNGNHEPPVQQPTSNNSTSKNHRPVAEAGWEQKVNEGDIVVLNGTRSSDPDKGYSQLKYSWKQIPTNGSQTISAVFLDNSTSPTPSFKAPPVEILSGNKTLTFELTVSDIHGAYDTDTVKIIVMHVNLAPIAIAEANRTEANEKEVVMLNGSKSFDPDGNITSYNWEQVGGSPSVKLKGKNTTIATFEVPTLGADSELTFRLTVVDALKGKGSDLVVLKIINMNSPPKAYAGEDLVVEESTQVTLNSTNSIDPDGSPLFYSWKQIEGEQVQLSNNNSSSTTFISPVITDNVKNEKTLVFQLTVNDGKYNSTDLMEVRVVDETAKNILLNAQSYTQSVITDIRKAEKSIQILTSIGNGRAEGYATRSILDELQSAKKRGVDVQLMVDDSNLSTTVKSDLKSLGIPYKIVTSHAKIVVIDKTIAYVGSSNWRQNGLQDNYELTLKTRRVAPISEANDYLTKLWSKDAKPVDFSSRISSGIDERFTNGPEFYDLLMENLKGAKSIKLLMYEMTYNYDNSGYADSQILNRVRQQHDRGAEVMIITEHSRFNSTSLSLASKFLIENNIPLMVDDDRTSSQAMHAKAVLIDNRLLFVGSQSWNNESLRSSKEVSIMTTDPASISQFLEIFNKKWAVSSSPAA